MGTRRNSFQTEDTASLLYWLQYLLGGFNAILQQDSTQHKHTQHTNDMISSDRKGYARTQLSSGKRSLTVPTDEWAAQIYLWIWVFEKVRPMISDFVRRIYREVYFTLG